MHLAAVNGEQTLPEIGPWLHAHNIQSAQGVCVAKQCGEKIDSTGERRESTLKREKPAGKVLANAVKLQVSSQARDMVGV